MVENLRHNTEGSSSQKLPESADVFSIEQQVAEQLKNDIVISRQSGKLPFNILRLSARYGIAPHKMRESVAILEEQKLVEVRPSVGIFINEAVSRRLQLEMADIEIDHAE